MIRKTIVAAALVLAAAGCAKAPEDTTAHYSVAGGRATVTVKAAANGDGVFQLGNQVMIRKGGVDYMILPDGGERVAVSVADFSAANDQLMKESGAKPQAPTTDIDYEAVEVGEETIAGQKGAIWRVQPKGGTTGETIQLVVSKDASFKNVADVLGLYFRLTSARNKQLTGVQTKAQTALDSVVDKGMVLRAGELMTLQDVTKGAIPPADYALPKVIDKAGVYKRLADAKAQMLQSAGKPGAGGAPDGSAPPAPAPVPAPSASASPAGK